MEGQNTSNELQENLYGYYYPSFMSGMKDGDHRPMNNWSVPKATQQGMDRDMQVALGIGFARQLMVHYTTTHGRVVSETLAGIIQDMTGCKIDGVELGFFLELERILTEAAAAES